MQSLAAYTFEANVSDAAERLSLLDALIDKWLVKKGAGNPSVSDGGFVSKTGGGVGQFSRNFVKSSIGNLREVELIETAHTGAMFTTSIQVVNQLNKVIVYASLHATPGESKIAPVGLYPNCPLVLQSMINKFSDWRFSGQEIPFGKCFDATAANGVAALRKAIKSETRKFPIVVVSNDEDELIWSDLHLRMAKQLIGLADVAVVNAESSWELTDALGSRNSCYLGSVRLYWPGSPVNKVWPGINWKASRLSSFGKKSVGRDKFLAIVRREIMSAAALTMTPPALSREIKSSAEKERLNALETDIRESALNSIVEENAILAEKLKAAENTIQALQWKLNTALYAERQTAANDEEGDLICENKPPQPGETRFYKKIGSGGGVDTLVQTKSCNHKESNWRPAFKGDQAEKGLLKLEGCNDWKSIAHCSSCTGGGRWRVNW